MIYTERFFLRELIASDVTDSYYSWFSDVDAQKYIDYSSQNSSKKALIQYVESKLQSTDALMLGIFAKNTQKHIGNIKFEPISIEKHQATVGILIGEKSWRNKGVAKEVMQASIEFLHENHGIKSVLLGVHEHNTAAIATYKKVGFIVKNKEREFIKMELTS